VHLAEGYEPSEELRKELLKFHNNTCTGFKKIQELEFVSGFLRNSNGKIIRNQFAR
ncbi:MAG: hypothetical protein K0S60_271, partial [Evtepia sp.]|nr:hypothetical protein [Evtepia sp.]